MCTTHHKEQYIVYEMLTSYSSYSSLFSPYPYDTLSNHQDLLFCNNHSPYFNPPYFL